MYYSVVEEDIEQPLDQIISDVILQSTWDKEHGFPKKVEPYLTAGFMFLEHAGRVKDPETRKKAVDSADDWFGNALMKNEEEYVG